MKKILKIALYCFTLVVMVLMVYHEAALRFLRRQLDSKEGILLSAFNRGAEYFRYADSLNLIFLVVSLCVALLSFVAIDQIWIRIVTGLAKRYPRVGRFQKYAWLSVPVQKLLSIATITLVFIVLCNLVIIGYGHYRSTGDAETIAEAKPVLVLGTRKRLLSGKGNNLYYTYRIDAAVQLWRLNKAAYFIVSGDRAGEHYDETRDIQADLVSFGVPLEKILLDTAGYRTLDSMLRIREMYHTRELVIISQAFHVQRALLLARFYGMQAIGFAAKGSATTGMLIREFFSKPKVILDLIIFNMQPKILVTGSSGVSYREDFRVTSDLHVVFLFVLATATLSTLGLVYKHLD